LPPPVSAGDYQDDFPRKLHVRPGIGDIASPPGGLPAGLPDVPFASAPGLAISAVLAVLTAADQPRVLLLQSNWTKVFVEKRFEGFYLYHNYANLSRYKMAYFLTIITAKARPATRLGAGFARQRSISRRSRPPQAQAASGTSAA